MLRADYYVLFPSQIRASMNVQVNFSQRAQTHATCGGPAMH